MADDLYERYKEALRTGHVAVLRGALADALAAYRLASQIAPSRATPHSSMGGVYLRMGRLDEALVEFEAAVEKAPHDEGALLGQAETLNASGMRPQAALALDHVAEIQEAAGRLPEACDTLRRALELDDDPERGKRQRALLRQIRFSAGDKAAEQKLARALRLRVDEPAEAPRPEPAPEPAPAASPARVPAAEPAPAHAMPHLPEPALSPSVAFAAFVAHPAPKPERLVVEPEPLVAELEPEPEFEPQPVPEPVRAREPEPEPVLDAGPEPEPEPVPAFGFGQPARPQPVGVMADAELVFGPVGPKSKGGPTPGGDELLAQAEAADASGDTVSLRSLLLWTARAYAREGRFEAGLDAAHRLLQRAPNDVDAHLALVELYLARRWDGLAVDKMRLLGRLAEFNDDEETRLRLSLVASRAFPEDEALASSLA